MDRDSNFGALSPLGDRYREVTKSLRFVASEFALMKNRFKIEIEYLRA